MRLPILIGTGILVGNLASPASAALYEIDFSLGGVGDFTGSFTAPDGGGLVSGFIATIQGVTYDTQTGGGAFEYDPAAGDFVNYSGFPSFSNSLAVPGVCGIGLCGLILYPTPNDALPGDYAAIDASDNNIDDGTYYQIAPAPVPLPQGLPLLAAVLAVSAFALRVTGRA